MSDGEIGCLSQHFAKWGWDPLTCRSIIGSFSQTYCFPRAIDLLDSGKIRTKGMVWVQGDWGRGKSSTDF